MKRWLFLMQCVSQFFAQSNTGELRLRITDISGAGVKSAVQLTSECSSVVAVAASRSFMPR